MSKAKKQKHRRAKKTAQPKPTSPKAGEFGRLYIPCDATIKDTAAAWIEALDSEVQKFTDPMRKDYDQWGDEDE